MYFPIYTDNFFSSFSGLATSSSEFCMFSVSQSAGPLPSSSSSEEVLRSIGSVSPGGESLRSLSTAWVILWQWSSMQTVEATASALFLAISCSRLSSLSRAVLMALSWLLSVCLCSSTRPFMACSSYVAWAESSIFCICSCTSTNLLLTSLSIWKKVLAR